MDEQGTLAKNLLIERRKRLVATLMNHIEATVFQFLNPAQQREMRVMVMTAVGSYHDVAIDIMRSVAGEAEVNDEALRLLRQIHGEIRRGP